MCNILGTFGIPHRIVTAIKNMFGKTLAKVIPPVRKVHVFVIKAGDLHGDSLTPFICIRVKKRLITRLDGCTPQNSYVYKLQSDIPNKVI